MRCDLGPQDHTIDHILPWLRDVKMIRPAQWHACCPAHDDRKPSLSIGLGSNGALLLKCHRGCPEPKVRKALIEAGVHARCLPRGNDDGMSGAVTQAEQVSAILRMDTSTVARVLWCAALLWHDGEMPAGDELDKLAREVHISHGAAYKYRKADIPRTRGGGKRLHEVEETPRGGGMPGPTRPADLRVVDNDLDGGVVPASAARPGRDARDSRGAA